VDRQLRGRAGRQGDPGPSQFFVSLEDDLMRLFGSARIAGIMDRMGLEEGEVIQAKMMSSAIERAQKKVEENNYGIRKRLLQYDDVMNSQREVIYTRRRHALFGERIELDLNNILWDFAEEFATNYEGADFEETTFELIRLAAVHPSFDEETYRKAGRGELAEMIVADLRTAYERRALNVAQVARPFIAKMYKDMGGAQDGAQTLIPITNGTLGYRVAADVRKTYETDCADIYKSFSKIVMLTTIDDNWREHLREMDDLRQSVQNATYEQKDPLLIYKHESFGLFMKMLAKVNREVLAIVNKSFIPVRTAPEGGQAPAQVQQRQRAQVDVNRLHASRMEAARQAGAGDRSKPMPVQVEKKVGRNDPCPCGSGKKYKNCHGALQ
jgi:preprotein translocase subunit SecA